MAIHILGYPFRPWMSLYFISVHLLGLVGLVTLFWANLASRIRLAVEVFLLWQITFLGITAGAHRLWAHRSYKASLPVRVFLMVCNTMCNQGSIFDWSCVHRVHHKFSDTSGDPHNIKRGFLFSHFLWTIVDREEEVYNNERKMEKLAVDLQADRVVMWQWKYYRGLAFLFCFVLPSIYGWLAHDSFLVGFLLHGCLRYSVTLNASYCVNSFAHLFGNRPYNQSLPAAENRFVSWITGGEGWHNWHHAYPFDYATSEFGMSQRFNTTKLFIDGCAYFGLVTDRKRATDHWKLKKAKIAEDSHTVCQVPQMH